MKKRLMSGKDVMISGFGKWRVRSKHARRGRHLQTGQEMVIEQRKVVTWSYSPLLKEAINGDHRGLTKGRRKTARNETRGKIRPTRLAPESFSFRCD
jgi:hypothetical protein